VNAPTEVRPSARTASTPDTDVAAGQPDRPPAVVRSVNEPEVGPRASERWTFRRGRMTPMRLAQNVSTAAVASIAAWSSWSHMVHVALKYGERPEVAYVLPISVDGMLVVASAAMVEDKRAGRNVRWSARIAFLAGMAASVAANIAAAPPSAGARIVAAWPAIALLLVVEILSRARRPVSVRADTIAPDSGHPVQMSMSVNDASPDLAPSPSPTRRRPRNGRPVPAVGEGPSRKSGAAEIVARIRSERPDATFADIAAQARVSERHVRRLLKSADHKPWKPTRPGNTSSLDEEPS
jgi:hypothetical protein